MSAAKREKWTEIEVLSLPAGEHDYFDRKSGTLLGNSDFREKLAKALSAFANSGGGHLILGVNDDGSIDGVDPTYKGRTRTRDWLEQVIPNLLSYTLEDFRVHEVTPSDPSNIPAGKVIIVIDVGDSVLAPHQSAITKQYYYRAGGRSELAPHFYLETLRNRLTSPSLRAMLEGIEFITAYPYENGVFVETELIFRVTNDGQIAAYKWALIWEKILNVEEEGLKGIRTEFHEFPRGSRGRSIDIAMDRTLLPSLSATEKRDLGFFIHLESQNIEDVSSALSNLFSPDTAISYRVISETSRGEEAQTKVRSVLSISVLAEKIITALSI